MFDLIDLREMISTKSPFKLYEEKIRKWLENNM